MPDVDAVGRQGAIVEQDPEVPAVGPEADTAGLMRDGRRLALDLISERLGGGDAGQDRRELASIPTVEDGGEDRLAGRVSLQEINAIRNGGLDSTTSGVSPRARSPPRPDRCQV